MIPALSRPGRRGPLPALSPLVEQMLKYGLASAAALAVDYGLVVALTELAGVHYLVSSAAGFCCGAVVAYGLSVRFVFQERRVANRGLEFALFVAIGVLALGLNQLLLMGLVEGAGLNYALAKLPVVGVVFLFNFLVRKLVLFSGPPATAAAAP